MKKVFGLAFVWRIFITLAMIFGMTLPVQLSFLGGGVKNYFISPLTWAWANFDGVHYLSIASVGYRQFEQAFFPLYPKLINLLAVKSGFNFIHIGLIISHLTFFLGLTFFYYLTRLEFPKTKNYWPVLFLLFFPTSYYFGSVYTESLFFFLSVGCFFAARKGWWWLCGLLGMFASATRIVGVFLFPVIILEFISSLKKEKSWYKLNILWLFLIPVGLFGYMYWLSNTYGDPLYFFHAQSAFGANRSSNFILLPQVFFRYLKIIFTASLNYQYVISIVEFLTSILSLVLIYFCFKKLRISYAVYALLLYLVPTLTGTFLSLPRFTLTIFPFFLVIPLVIKSDKMRIITLFISSILLFILTMFFTRGYWIS